MRAAFYEKNGAARDVLSVAEVDTPKPGPGEVRVKLKTSGVNPSDVKAREGRTRKIAFPRVIPHSDGAGEIEAVGDGVPASRKGERVWIWNAQWKRAFGTCAEYVVLPAQYAVPLPAHISDEAGACLGIPAMTAWNAVEVAGRRQRQDRAGHRRRRRRRPLRHPVRQGDAARPCSPPSAPTPRPRSRKQAGADHTIDYKRENVGERVMALTGKAGVDAVVEMDVAANAKLYPGILHARSQVVIYGTGSAEATIPSQFLLTNGIRLQFIFVYELTAAERTSAVTGINRMLENKTLINNVALTLPLKDIVAAHEAVEQGKAMGNVVVTL